MSEFPATLQFLALASSMQKGCRYAVAPDAARTEADKRARLRRCADALAKGASFRRLRWSYSALEIADARKMVGGK
jgi:hypothetical protein